MTRRSRAGIGSLPAALGAALVGVLLVSGCGGSGGSATPASTRAPVLGHDAIAAPAATELKPGESVHVPPSTVHTVGWQVACSANGRRVNAEAVRGQRTGSGQIAGFKGGHPSIWISHNRNGSISVSCH